MRETGLKWKQIGTCNVQRNLPKILIGHTVSNVSKLLKIRVPMQVLLLHMSNLAAPCRIWNISGGLLGQGLIKINDGLRPSLMISATQLYWYKVYLKYLYFLYLSTTIWERNCRMHLCMLSLLPAGIKNDVLKLSVYVAPSHTTYLPSLCDGLCQSSHVLSMFILGSIVPIRQLSRLPISARTWTCIFLKEISFLLHSQQSLCNGCGDNISTVFETRAIDRAYPIVELKTTLTWMKKYGFIVILIKRISVTQLDRGLDGHTMEEYIMVLA